MLCALEVVSLSLTISTLYFLLHFVLSLCGEAVATVKELLGCVSCTCACLKQTVKSSKLAVTQHELLADRCMLTH